MYLSTHYVIVLSSHNIMYALYMWLPIKQKPNIKTTNCCCCCNSKSRQPEIAAAFLFFLIWGVQPTTVGLIQENIARYAYEHTGGVFALSLQPTL